MHETRVNSVEVSISVGDGSHAATPLRGIFALPCRSGLPYTLDESRCVHRPRGGVFL